MGTPDWDRFSECDRADLQAWLDGLVGLEPEEIHAALVEAAYELSQADDQQPDAFDIGADTSESHAYCDLEAEYAD